MGKPVIGDDVVFTLPGFKKYQVRFGADASPDAAIYCQQTYQRNHERLAKAKL
jgi:hypothetical protein